MVAFVGWAILINDAQFNCLAVGFRRVVSKAIMKQLTYTLAVAFLLMMFATVAESTEGQTANSAAAEVRVYPSSKAIKWGPPPPVVPKGAEAAVLDGEPFKDGEAYTLRLKMPDGYKIPPHWHPTDENVTVVSGTLGAGMGDKFETAKGWLLKPGGFLRMPKGMHHFAWAKGPTVVQVHGVGPFAFLYVNPADDPRNQH
jgi:Domain of unknown function (DUF4437)